VKIAPAVGINSEFWAGRRVLITGHTGFKGAWLSLWLQALGAELTGFALGPPTRPSLYELASVGTGMHEHAVDVRDGAAVLGALRAARPEVVLHLAAQPLVRRALLEPELTYQVNVMGTVNVLEAVRAAGGVRAVVVVTSDKVYANPSGQARRFVESDPLGGAEPYSSSKACAELVAGAYRRAFFSGSEQPRLATARAGNVIGGGDWGAERLIPDVVRAVERGAPVRLRSPDAVRPWQHVLNPVSGYMLLAERLWRAPDAQGAWNFGPAAADTRPVRWVVQELAGLWDGALSWALDAREHPAEAEHLAVDSAAAERELGWRVKWRLREALERLVDWHRAERRGEDMRAASLEQIASFTRS
jgi:CDP-glucose 4,6-dehydratase